MGHPSLFVQRSNSAVGGAPAFVILLTSLTMVSPLWHILLQGYGWQSTPLPKHQRFPCLPSASTVTVPGSATLCVILAPGNAFFKLAS